MPVFLLDVAGDVSGRAVMRPAVGLGIMRRPGMPLITPPRAPRTPAAAPRKVDMVAAQKRREEEAARFAVLAKKAKEDAAAKEAYLKRAEVLRGQYAQQRAELAKTPGTAEYQALQPVRQAIRQLLADIDRVTNIDRNPALLNPLRNFLRM